MRITISIDDALLAQLKRDAVERGTTVSCLIEDSVRLASRAGEGGRGERAFEVVTFGKGGRFTSLDVDKTAELLELDDDERFGTSGG